MRKFFLLSCFMVFAVPLAGFINLRGTDIWYVQYLGLFSVFCLAITFRLWSFNRFLAVFSLLCLVSAIVTANQSPKAILCLVQINFSLMFVYIISRFNKRKAETIIYCLLALSLFQFSWVLLQYFHLDPVFSRIIDQTKDDTVGISGSFNQIGIFFADMMPVIASYFPIGVPAAIFSLWCSKTSTAVISAALSTIFCLCFLKRVYTRYVLLAMIPFIFVFFNKLEPQLDGVIKERAYLIKKTISQVVKGEIMITDMEKHDIKILVTTNPLFGFGLGNFNRTSSMDFYQTFGEYDFGHRPQHRYEHVHNDMVEAFFELGWLGLLSLMLIIGDLTFKFIFSEKTKLLVTSFSGILAHFISSNGVYTVQTAISGMLLIIFLGIFYGEAARQRRLNG